MPDLTLRSQMEHLANLVQTSQATEAVQVARRILRAFPKAARAYTLLGQAYLALGRQAEAAELLRRALGADPEQAGAYAGLGTLYEAQGWVDEARWQFERALELEPSALPVRQALMRLHAKQGAPRGRVKPTQAALARAYLRGQLYGKASAEWREVLAREPQRPDARAALAEALWRGGRADEAAEVCRGLLVELPHCLKANLLLGAYWLGTERDAEARACLQRAQAVDPENALAQALLGAHSPLPPRTARLPLEDEAPSAMEDDLAPDQDSAPLTIEGRAQAPAQPGQPGDAPVAPETPASHEPTDGPPWLAQAQWVQAHPGDHAARLALARRLRDVGMLAEALGHYAALVDAAAAAEVTSDLESLKKLYPAHEGLAALAQRAARQHNM